MYSFVTFLPNSLTKIVPGCIPTSNACMFPKALPIKMLSCFFILANPTDEKWSVSLCCFSAFLKLGETWNNFCTCEGCVYTFANCWFPIFLLGFGPWVCNFEECCLCQGYQPFICDMTHATNALSQLVSDLLTMPMVVFTMQNYKNFYILKISSFLLPWHFQCQKVFLTLPLKRNALFDFLQYLYGFTFQFRSLVHWSLFWGMDEMQIQLYLMVTQHHLLISLSLFQLLEMSASSHTKVPCDLGLISGFLILFHQSIVIGQCHKVGMF